MTTLADGGGDRPRPEEGPVGVVSLGAGLFRFLMDTGRMVDLDLTPLRQLPALAALAGEPHLFDGLAVAQGRLRWAPGVEVDWQDVRAVAKAGPARGFSVDTHLFRELGELLVGRESTAALELVKNAYDADATVVTLDGVSLRGDDGSLVVLDDGNGMTRHRFVTAFLRVASRSKEGADRRSARRGRRYTGEKGIGRLAAHKLASVLEVTSIPRPDLVPKADEGAAADTEEELTSGVSALIDWDAVEERGSLDDVGDGLRVASLPPDGQAMPGSTFVLRRLRSRWTDDRIASFVREMKEAQPPGVLTDPSLCPPLAEPAMLPAPRYRDSSDDDPGFVLRLTGDLDAGEDFFQLASQDFRWLVEIDGREDVVRYQITPVASYARQEPLARTYRFQRTQPLEARPAFTARIFTYPGASTRRGPLKTFTRSSTGVRVYQEGFRVLPYGESGDDWLGIDRGIRQGERTYKIAIDKDGSDDLFDVEGFKEGLNATSNNGYVGAVFLLESGSLGLRSLVNREGFVPDAAFDALVDLVSTGIKLSVRVRRAVQQAVIAREEAAALAAALDEPDRVRKPAPGDPPPHGPDEGPPGPVPGLTPGQADPRTDAPPGTDDLSEKARQALGRAQDAAQALRAAGPAAVLTGDVADVVSGLAVATAELDRLRAQQPDLRVLASVGLQLGAFIHDINGLLGQARTVRELLEPLATDEALSRPQRARVRRVAAALEDLGQALDRQASYLTDVVSTDSRRRRRRIAVADRLDVSRRLLSAQLSRLGVELDADLPPDLRTPPMFPAELTVLLNNLLTNAIKNAGRPGRVLVAGRPMGDRGLTLTVSNTGVAVDLTDADRWFMPFETTTTSIDEVLGQGLGLGLPITLALVEDYRGTIAFVEPRPGYATEIRVDLPDPQEIR